MCRFGKNVDVLIYYLMAYNKSSSAYQLFVRLIQVSLGTRSELDAKLSESEFYYCFKEAKRQTLLGVLSEAAIKSFDSSRCSDVAKKTRMQWLAFTVKIEDVSRKLDTRACELTQKFSDIGLRSCILKGQSIARYYPSPHWRQCGDIDIWVDGGRNEIVKSVSRIGEVGDIFYHHMELNCFKDASVEVHFLPSWFFNPITNRRFHKWISKVKQKQFTDRYDVGFNSPDIEFDLVFSLIHIYRHVIDGGVGLRQLMDYYYILIHSTKEQRQIAFKVISGFRMAGFCSGVMYVLRNCFLMDDQYCMTEPSAKYGEPISEEIFIGGNFGKYDKRNANRHSYTIKGMLWALRNNIRLLKHYPSEASWAPFFKIWQYAMIHIWK